MVLGDWLYPLFIGACVVVAAVAAYFGWRPERPGGEAEPAEPTAVPLPVVVPGPLPDKQMGKSRIGGLALLALLVVAYFIGQSGDSKTTSTSSGSQQPTETYRTTAGQLFDQYAANEVATDRALKGKIVEISGTVQDITKDVWGYLRVGLRTSMPASMQVVAEQEARLAALQKGQYVTLRCPKMKRWVGTPYGDNCVLQ
jgi:hypothetical protein